MACWRTTGDGIDQQLAKSVYLSVFSFWTPLEPLFMVGDIPVEKKSAQDNPADCAAGETAEEDQRAAP